MSEDFRKLSVEARIELFDRRNGGNSVVHNDWILYSNGAMRELWALGALIDPPSGEWQLYNNILLYHQARQAIAVREFDNFKEQLMMSVPDGEGIDRLKQLQTVVQERNQAVTDAQAKLAKTKHGRQLERNRRCDAEYREQQNEFKSRVRDIRI